MGLPVINELSSAESAPSVESLPGVPIEGLYVHVPFCHHKCHYCDFYSITRQTPERMSGYVDRVLVEGGMWAQGRGRREGFGTVFFGGGTPSLLPVEELARLIGGLRDLFDLNAVREFTIECNPATVSREWLEVARGMGVNRLSFGAQSFNPSDLKMLERHHDPEEVPRSLELAREAGFERLNLDLIFGVPGQSLEGWDETLRQGLACGTDHLSAYLLTYEPNTPMAVRKRLGQLTAAEESLELEMLAHTRRVMAEAGMPAYEISNYARPGEECLHNLMYWNGGSYIGLGPSAASHVQGYRFRNRPHLGEWERAVEQGRLPTIEAEHLPADRREAELGYLMIRLMSGVDYGTFKARTGTEARERFAEAIGKLRPLGLIEADDRGFRLTDKGVPLADAVASELL